jgi:2-oxo-4-hydroxy-4-carboxy-5-ureidoimidazoline decarboxylase
MEPWSRLDTARAGEARRLLTTCCGSTLWVEGMMKRRPFGSQAMLSAAAQLEWYALSEDDWREAFTHHPKIGDREAMRAQFAATSHLSEREQAGADGAPDDVLDALAQGNRAYEQTFGYIFIVCATGKTAGQMLDLLRARLPNPPDVEIRIAAGEQAKITQLRLRSI